MTTPFAPTTTRPELAAERPASSGRQLLSRRLPVAVLAALGAGTVVYGVSQPWITSFAGLLGQSGWGSRNGNILLVGAVVVAVLALAQLFVAERPLRWALASVGFAGAAFTGHLLIELYAATRSSDSMILLGKGHGLYIVAAGAALVFATIFLPMPASRSAASDAAGVPLTADQGIGVDSWWLRALNSRLRFPAALLAVIAGLAHVPVTPEHLQEAPYIGVLFITLTVVCVLGAAALLMRDMPVVWAGLGGACLLAVIGYVVSRTVGLPLMGDDVGNWLESLGVISVVTESAVALLAGFALLQKRR